MNPTIQSQIEERLRELMHPAHLEVVDESWQHGGGAGHKVTIKSSSSPSNFRGKTLGPTPLSPEFSLRHYHANSGIIVAHTHSRGMVSGFRKLRKLQIPRLPQPLNT